MDKHNGLPRIHLSIRTANRRGFVGFGDEMHITSRNALRTQFGLDPS